MHTVRESKPPLKLNYDGISKRESNLWLEMLLLNTSRIGNYVITMGRNESDGSLVENVHEITINKAKWN